MNRRSVLRGGTAAAVGMLAITAMESGATPASAHGMYEVMGNPAVTGDGLPFPKNLTREEYEHLKTFDEADFVVFSNQQWSRLVPPTGKTFAMNMITVGIFNRHGTMDEELFFYDNLAFNQQIGLA
jgi:hypothetical protein